jgi:hypothetical protein
VQQKLEHIRTSASSAAKERLANVVKKSRKGPKKTLDPQVDIAVWDFGGQWSFYSTHTLFLSLRGIYLVIVDLSKPLEAPIEHGCPVDSSGLHDLDGLGTACTKYMISTVWVRRVHSI